MTRTEFHVADKSLGVEERGTILLPLSRGVFAALQAALQHVRSYNDLIEDDVRANATAAGYFERSQNTLARAMAWLQCGLQATGGRLDTEKVDLFPVLEGVVQRCRRIAPKEREIAFCREDEAILVDASVFQLQEALLELLGLVVASRDGTVVAKAEATQLAAATLGRAKSVCLPGLYAAIVFGPAGTGFPFDSARPFHDALLLRQPGDASVECDLLRAYGVVLGHEGDVFCDGTLGHLAVVLPMEAKRKDMQVEPHLDDESLYGNETILLVDDEDMIWDVITDMLQELGYAVILAGNGVEAVEIYRENPGLIDLVMLDMVMPRLDGHGAFFQLKAIDPNVRVLLSSGYVSEEDARDVLEAGAVGFLQKPYRMVDLARRIRVIFDGSG